MNEVGPSMATEPSAATIAGGYTHQFRRRHDQARPTMADEDDGQLRGPAAVARHERLDQHARGRPPAKIRMNGSSSPYSMVGR